MMLTLLVLPVFILGIKKVFLFQDRRGTDGKFEFNAERPEIGYGIYEGLVFLASALLTAIITTQITFGTSWWP